MLFGNESMTSGNLSIRPVICRRFHRKRSSGLADGAIRIVDDVDLLVAAELCDGSGNRLRGVAAG